MLKMQGTKSFRTRITDAELEIGGQKIDKHSGSMDGGMVSINRKKPNS